MGERSVQRFVDTNSTSVITQIVTPYREAFAGYPWFEELTDSQVQERIEKDLSRPGFGGICLLDVDEGLVGASWYYNSDLETLAKEKGQALSEFAQQITSELKIDNIVWHSMTLVSPAHQGKGVGTELKKVIFEDLQTRANNSGSILYLTRIRDDNFGSQKMNEPYGLARTGIKVPSSQVEGLTHEYWFKIITQQNN